VILSAAAVLSALLVSKHFGGGPPGCGPASDCEVLEKTPWGKVPGMGWPVSFIGLAYFIALLVGWAVTHRELPRAGRWLFRAGGAASLLFVGVMLAYRKLCPYCAGVHAANLAALAMIERETWRAPRRSPAGGDPVAGGRIGKAFGGTVGAFLSVSLALAVADASLQRKGEARAEEERRASTAKILAQAEAQASTDTPASSPPADMWGPSGFTGRYRLGPEASPIRIVMLMDYQCADCRRLEHELEGILASRSDVSLSVKHYPMCAEAAPGVPCNRYAKKCPHANACWAARAAEAAGILRGDEGFWEIHRWLFSRQGVFTDAELRAAVTDMGYSSEAFLSVMRGPETLRRVQADCEEGSALGLYFTPMVFVNGLELKGWQDPGALRRTVEEVAAKDPPALKATADRPVLAGTKDIQDWRDQPLRTMPPDARAWSLGAESERSVAAGSRFVDVVLFGDYQEPYTASMDVAIRDLMRSRPNVRYTFRHYPIDPKINPAVPARVRPEALHPLAGRAAQAAEAAGSLAGAEGYWKMHDWLMANPKSFSDGSLRDAAPSMGIDPDALFAEMETPTVTAAIVEDARAAKQLGLTGVPMVFVNRKWVQRTRRAEENIVLRVIEEAGRSR
jgi:protein-disulfide isomerase/uncharacterized membrane protein